MKAIITKEGAQLLRKEFLKRYGNIDKLTKDFIAFKNYIEFIERYVEIPMEVEREYGNRIQLKLPEEIVREDGTKLVAIDIEKKYIKLIKDEQ